MSKPKTAEFIAHNAAVMHTALLPRRIGESLCVGLADSPDEIPQAFEFDGRALRQLSVWLEKLSMDLEWLEWDSKRKDRRSPEPQKGGILNV